MAANISERMAVVVSVIVLVAVTASWADTPASTFATERSVERILWVGSSSTYFNYMGKQVADWLTAANQSGARYVTHVVWKNATRIHEYLIKGGKTPLGLDEGQSILDRIRDGGYKYVVLQVVAQKMPDPTEGPGLNSSLDVYVQAIRDAGSEPVFYEQGWGSSTDLAMHKKGEEMIFEAAVRNKVRLVAPCAHAWDLVRKERPHLQLHELPDIAHPGSLGNFLNGCVFYATLTGKAPHGMPRTMVAWEHTSNDQTPPQVKNSAAKDIWKSDSGFRDYIGPYSDAVRGHLVTIDDETAIYLEDAAWRACQDYTRRLNTALDRMANIAGGGR